MNYKTKSNKSKLESKRERLELENSKLEKLIKRCEAQKIKCTKLEKAVKQLENEIIVETVRNSSISIGDLKFLLSGSIGGESENEFESEPDVYCGSN